jgi:hypothetical protein
MTKCDNEECSKEATHTMNFCDDCYKRLTKCNTPNCNGEVTNSFNFCSKCYAQIQQIQKKAAEDLKRMGKI